jgi:hypothetical protein
MPYTVCYEASDGDTVLCTGMEKNYMTYEEAIKTIQPGRYRHFKGNEYEVIGIARHSEDESPVVVYRALYGDGGLWVRPAEMWNETVTRDGVTYKRFTRIGT